MGRIRLPDDSPNVFVRSPTPESGMYNTAFSTDNFPRADRLARFDELQTTSDHPMRAFGRPDSTGDFNASVESLDLAAVNVVRLTSSRVDIVRTPRQVREFDPEFYSIVLPVSGRVLLEQGGRQAVLKDGLLALYTSSQPFRVHVDAPEGATSGASEASTASLLRVQVPRALLPLPAARLEEMVAAPLPGTSGVGALLTAFLDRLSADACEYTPADLSRLGNVLVDLLNATLAHRLDADGPRHLAQSILPLRITAFVDQNLEEPGLSPSSIAAAHHISVSYLHRLFHAHHTTTVGAYIRDQRLERARRDLTDPQLRALPIHRIAARWGFPDHATFTRAFRARFGVPPSEYRTAADPVTADRAGRVLEEASRRG